MLLEGTNLHEILMARSLAKIDDNTSHSVQSWFKKVTSEFISLPLHSPIKCEYYPVYSYDTDGKREWDYNKQELHRRSDLSFH